jgi:xylulokinase
MSHVLGIDLGTSNLKVALVDRSGQTTALIRTPISYTTGFTSEGEITSVVDVAFLSGILKAAIKDAIAQTGNPLIEAVSYSSQANTFLLVDPEGTPLTPFVSWQDQRAEGLQDLVESICKRPEFTATTGLGVFSTGMAAAKLSWIQRHEPFLWRRVGKVLSISDFLCHALTDRYPGDSGTASLSGLWDIRREQWWSHALSHFGLSEDMLPRPCRPGKVIGRISLAGAVKLGLPEGIPVAAGSLDHHMAAIGAGVGEVSDASESTGTVVACVRPTDQFEPADGKAVGPGVTPETYFELAFADGGGSILRDYRKRAAAELSFAELDSLAEVVAPTDGLLISYLNGDSVEVVDDNHGVHARAIMEAVAIRLARLIDTVYPDGRPRCISSTGGGGASSIWAQIKADVLDCDIVQPRSEEPACQGAAFFAAAAAGWYSLEQGIPAAWVRPRKVFHPSSANKARYARLLVRLQAI